MLASITPFGERSRGFSWRLTASAFAVGSIGAGALIGAALGAAGALLPPGRPWHAAVALLTLALALLLDLGPLRRYLPTSRRQVNEDWLARYRGWVYGVGFGAQLGAGVATIVSSAAVYAAGAFALLSGAPATGALIGGAFGLVRALALLPARGVRDPAALALLHRRLAALENVTARAATGIEAVVLLAALVVVAS